MSCYTDSSGQRYLVYAECNGFLNVFGTLGVNIKITSTNDIMEVRSVLGLEAARQVIVDEVSLVSLWY